MCHYWHLKRVISNVCLYIDLNSADNARNNSERVRNEAVRLMRDREDKTVLTQRDADRRIGERLHDVTFWRSELQVHIIYFAMNIFKDTFYIHAKSRDNSSQ